jgi:hypothetical protein
MPLQAVTEGRRNNTLFASLLRYAKSCDSYDGLFDIAMRVNSDMFGTPLDTAEVANTTASAWRTEVDGENWVGKEARVITLKSQFDRILAHPNGSDAFLLFTKLRFAHWGCAEFAVSPKAMWQGQTIPGWGHQRYRNAIAALVERGFVAVVHEGGRGEHDPRLYSFSDALLPKGTELVPNITRTPPPLAPFSLQGVFEAERQKVGLRTELKKSAEIANSTKARIAGSKR